jgi:hypothetical protein
MPEDERSAMLRFALRFTLAALLAVTPALAASPAEQRGKAYALSLLAAPRAQSHEKQPAQVRAAISNAPLRYPIETLGEPLAEGIYTGHAEMPALDLNPDQIHDLLSYLKTFE